MVSLCRAYCPAVKWLLVPVLATALVSGGSRHAQAQLGAMLPSTQFELSDTVQLDRADNTVLSHLERVKAYLADHQWNEAVETLRQVMEGSDAKLLGVTDRRYVRLRDYCHLQLATLPPEALKLYRSRVDSLARKWCEEGVAGRDRKLLLGVIDQAFASSWGDKALMALGEMALESGDYTSARWHWERIIPSRAPAGVPRTWPGYPDSDLDLAAVRARLVLTSILEGSTARARDELTQFARLHPDARGRLGGVEVNYAEALAALLAESGAWPQAKPTADWPTFAGSMTRNTIAPERIEVGSVAWRVPLPRAKPGLSAAAASVAESADAPLSYHPLVVGDLVLVNNPLEILAFRASTGKPAWGTGGPAVYRDEQHGAAGELFHQPDALGTPRFTMTAVDGKLYARMGVAATSRPQEALPSVGAGYLVCLDLAAEGRLSWKIVPEEGWTFEGSPVADGGHVYVAMRRNDVQPQAHAACFDAQSGRLRWRRFVCGADTPARGMLYQITHNLLTLHQGTIYYNTNLGAVAALSADDGRVLWLSLYPRARSGDLAKPAPHWQRDLNPCVYDRGALLVAPADSPRIFALDAATGQILWQTGTEVEDAVHLLGTTGDWLIAGGWKLYWISLKEEDKGRVKHVWPDSHLKPGYGRGVLAADCVLFPTREKLGDKTLYQVRLFDQKTAELKKTIDLSFRGQPPVTAGNLFVADGWLLVAAGTELIALSRDGVQPKEEPAELTTVP